MTHDDESKADTTVRVVKKLIAEDRAHVVIPSSQSPTSPAAVPVQAAYLGRSARE